MARPRKQYRLVPGPQPGDFHLPDGSATVYFNPVERTLYKLFMNHPDGIPVNALPLYWQELCKGVALVQRDFLCGSIIDVL